MRLPVFFFPFLRSGISFFFLAFGSRGTANQRYEGAPSIIHSELNCDSLGGWKGSDVWGQRFYLGTSAMRQRKMVYATNIRDSSVVIFSEGDRVLRYLCSCKHH